MAISQSQKVDFLYKKLGFTKTKTGLSVDGALSGTKKAGFGEVFASPLVIADSSVWNQSELIPTTPPGSDTSIVKGYRVASALRMTVDATTAGRRSYIAYTTFNDTSSARLTNWIDTQFGNDYVVKVYAGDPNSGGTLLPAGGTTGNDSWFFDYSAGILQFHDTTIHSNIDANGSNIYIVGYRYIGQTGVISIGDDTNFGDLTVNNNFRVVGLSTFVGAVNLNNNLSVAGITTLAGLSTVTGHTLFTKQLNVSGITTFKDDVEFHGVSGITSVSFDKSDNSFKFVDDAKLKVGTGLTVHSDGTNILYSNTSNVLHTIENSGQREAWNSKVSGIFVPSFKINHNSAVEAYYANGSIKFSTSGIGATIYGQLDTTQLTVSGVSTFSGAIDADGDLDVDGHTELDDLNVTGISTFQNKVHLLDNDVLNLGGSLGEVGDLLIFANGTTNAIDARNSPLTIRNNVSNTGGGFAHNIQIQAKTGESSAIFNPEGSVDLYFDDEIRFETTGIGVSVLAGTGNTATIAGPQFLILDPDGVGVNTGVVRIKGDLIVDGEQTIIKSTELEIADFIVGIASTATTDALADGAGFKIGPDNTLLYEHNSGTNPSLKSSENLNVATGKVYQIAEVERLSADTLSLGTGTTIHSPVSNILTFGTNSTERIRISDDGIIVAGISTFSNNIVANGNIDLAGDIDVDGHTELDNLNVSGISTFAGITTVTGHTLFTKQLSVSGISTFAGNIDANGIIEGIAGENKIPSLYNAFSDLPTANDYHGLFAHVHATQKGYFAHGGAWYELVNRKLDGTVGTGTDSYNVGIITATQADIGDGGLDVDGHTELDNLNVAGVSTFNSNVNVNADVTANSLTLDDDGTGNNILTVKSDDENPYGFVLINDTYKSSAPTGYKLSQFNSGEIEVLLRANTNATRLPYKIRQGNNPSGIWDSFTINADGAVGLAYSGNQKLSTTGYGVTVFGTTETQKLNVTGISTFEGNIDANGNLDVDGYTELDDLNVSGVSTFAGAIDANGDLDVDGQTNLDDVSIAGVTTIADDKKLYLGNDQDLELYYQTTGVAGVQINSGTASGNLTIRNKDAGQYVYIHGDHVHLRSQTGNEAYLQAQRDGAVSLYYDSSTYSTPKFTTTGYGATVFGTTETQKLNVTGISTVVGVGTFKDDVYIDKKLYVAGIEIGGPGGPGIGTDITTRNLKVTGIATVTGNTDLNGDLDVDGLTNLDNTIVAGIATFTNVVTKFSSGNGGNTHLQVLSTGAGEAGIFFDAANGDISGSDYIFIGQQNNLDFIIKANPNAGNIDFQRGTDTKVRIDTSGNLNVNYDLDVDGHTELDNLNVSGVSTFVGNTNIGTGGTVFTAIVGAAASIGIGDASPSYMLDVAGAINSQTDVKVNGVSVTEQALNDAVAMAIALG